MDNVSLRAPREEDWPALAVLGNLAISEMEIPPSQEPWAENRRLFPADGIQRHYVAISDGRIVGYAGAEWRKEGPTGWFRVFVIIAPHDRATLGRWLFGKIRETLISLSATTAWMMEYEDDKGLLAFMEQVGFEYFRSLTTPDGFRAVQMKMDAPFDSLKISN
jgi:hypothetical protein